MSHFISSLVMVFKREGSELNLGANQVAFLLSSHMQLFLRCVANLFPPNTSLIMGHPSNRPKLGYIYQIAARGLNQPNYEELIRSIYICLYAVVRRSNEGTYSDVCRNEIVEKLLEDLKSIGAVDADEAIQNEIFEHLDYIAKKISDYKKQFTITIYTQDSDFVTENLVGKTGNNPGPGYEPQLLPPQWPEKKSGNSQQKDDEIELQGVFMVVKSSKSSSLLFKAFGSEEEFKVEVTPELAKNISERQRKINGKPPLSRIGTTKDKYGRVKLYDIY